MALQNLPSPLCEERGGVFSFLAPRHALAIMEVVATHPWAIAGQIAAGERKASSRTRLWL